MAPKSDYVKIRFFGLVSLFQAVFWILFPIFSVPGVLGVVFLVTLSVLSCFYFSLFYFAYFKKKLTLKQVEFGKILAILGFLVHIALLFFIDSNLTNVTALSTGRKGLFLLQSFFFWFAILGSTPGDVLLYFLASSFSQKIRSGTFVLKPNETDKINKYFEFFEALFIAAILAIFIRGYFVQAFKIPSGSMENTLLVGDHLLVNKFIYGTRLPILGGQFLQIHDPQRGNIIVFEFPEDEGKFYFQRRDFIKRVVGVPGDVVEVKNKKVYVNDELYRLPQEVHKDSGVVPPEKAPRDFMKPIKVPEGMYFVMGDNRDQSYDSRFWGFVEREKIKGLAFIKYWSWNTNEHWPRWERIGRPIY